MDKTFYINKYLAGKPEDSVRRFFKWDEEGNTLSL